MHEQRPPTALTAHFTLTPEALARFQERPVIAGQYPVAAVPTGEAGEEIDIYLDTADYGLLRTGFAIRLTQTNGQHTLTVENLAAALAGKLDKAVTERMPVGEPVTDGEAVVKRKAWPPSVRKAVAKVLPKHAKVHPILLIQRQREAYTLMQPATEGNASVVLAQLQLAQVRVWRPTAKESSFTVPSSTADATLRQLSLTFCSDTVEVQEVIRTWLANQPGFQSTHQPTIEQALLAVNSHARAAPTAGLQPQMTVADGCRLIWREQLMVMLLNEAGVRYSQDREYVHEMRVAIRRMRAAGKLYGRFLPRKTIRPFLAALRKTGRFLGQVRNLDVTIAKARRPRTAQGQGAKAPKKLVSEWQSQRQYAHQMLVHWLDSAEYREFLDAFLYFCTAVEGSNQENTPFDAATPTPRQIRHVIPVQIMDGFAAVRCYEALFEAAVPVAYATLHDLRIACKHLRYNLEFARPLLGAECEVLIKRLKAVQELLGDLNDAVVAQTLLTDAAKEQKVDAYQQAQAQLMADLRARVPAAVATLIDQNSRSQLGQALAQL